MIPASTSNLSLNDMLDYASVLLELFETQDWSKFEDIALSKPKLFKMISKTISECAEFHGMTLLHACVRYDPPISILKKMITLYPKAMMAEDCLGRTPLHVAAGSDASPYVLKLLVVNYPQACSIQDDDGRIPLHFVCDTSCELFEEEVSFPRDPPRLDAVRVLLAGSLESVVLEDLDEMNAVEYAIVSNASMDVVNLLQRASQRIRKNSIKKSTSSRGYSATTRAMAQISVN